MEIGILVFCAIILFIVIGFVSVGTREDEQPTYEDLLQKDEWKKRRDEILARDGHRCVKCKSANNLQVHHRYYAMYPNNEMAKPWDYPDDALVTLCKNCHAKEHMNHKIKTYRRGWTNRKL